MQVKLLRIGDTGEMHGDSTVFRIAKDGRADRGAMSAQLVCPAGDRQQGEPARLRADALSHMVIGDGALAFLGIGADPFTLATGKLGERQIDASLPQFGQPDDDRPIDLARSLFAEGSGQESRCRDGAREYQNTACFLVEPVDEARPHIRSKAQRVQHPVEMPFGAAAALDGETRWLI